MRTLLVVPYFPPDNGPIPLMYGALADDICASGRELLVLTGQPCYGAGARRSMRPYQIEARPGKRVVRVFVPRLNRNSLLSRFAVVAWFNILAGLYLLFARNIGSALVTNPAFEIFLVAVAIRLKRIPFHYRVHDLYPEIAFRLGLLRRGGRAARVIDRMERGCLSRARTISVVTSSFKRFLESQGVPGSKIAVVPDWADTNAIRPGPKDNPFSRTHGLVDKFVIGYGGNVGRSQGLETLLEAAAVLRGEEHIAFLIVGEGAALDALVGRARALRLTNVLFLPYQDPAALSGVYASWDAGFVSLAPRVSPEWCPAKLYTIIAAGRPVLASADSGGEVHDIVSRSGCGVWCEPGDAASLARAVHDLSAQPGGLRQSGIRARRLAEQRYSRAVCSRRLVELLDSAPSVRNAENAWPPRPEIANLG